MRHADRFVEIRFKWPQAEALSPRYPGIFEGTRISLQFSLGSCRQPDMSQTMSRLKRTTCTKQVTNKALIINNHMNKMC